MRRSDTAQSQRNSQLREVGNPSRNKLHQKPEHKREPKPSHLHQQLRIIIVGFIDEKVGIKAAIARDKSSGKFPNPTPCIGLVREHFQTVFGDIQTDVGV